MANHSQRSKCVLTVSGGSHKSLIHTIFHLPVSALVGPCDNISTQIAPPNRCPQETYSSEIIEYKGRICILDLKRLQSSVSEKFMIMNTSLWHHVEALHDTCTWGWTVHISDDMKRYQYQYQRLFCEHLVEQVRNRFQTEQCLQQPSGMWCHLSGHPSNK